jgi:hypothetical protein
MNIDNINIDNSKIDNSKIDNNKIDNNKIDNNKIDNNKINIDDFLTSLPEMTFFKLDHKRYTKFSLFSYIQEFKGNNLFGEFM